MQFLQFLYCFPFKLNLINLMSCNSNSISVLKFCITFEDYYFILLNAVIIGVLSVIFYVKIMILDKERRNLTMTLKYPFTLLGEGPLSQFYSISSSQSKPNITKRKVQAKATTAEKNMTCELSCRRCPKTIEVNYQYTFNKLLAQT